jgi:hypothetical protein
VKAKEIQYVFAFNIEFFVEKEREKVCLGKVSENGRTDRPTDQRTKSQVNCNRRLTHEWPIRQKRKKNSFDIGMRKGKLTYSKEGNVISNTVGKEGKG